MYWQISTDGSVFQPSLDVLGAVIYATEFVLWLGIFACGGYYNLRSWLRERPLVKLEQQQEPDDLRSRQPVFDATTTCKNGDRSCTRHSATYIFHSSMEIRKLKGRLAGLEQANGYH
jgi:hypothetical protein